MEENEDQRRKRKWGKNKKIKYQKCFIKHEQQPEDYFITRYMMKETYDHHHVVRHLIRNTDRLHVTLDV